MYLVTITLPRSVTTRSLLECPLPRTFKRPEAPSSPSDFASWMTAISSSVVLGK
jgi:hypothetical protein